MVKISNAEKLLDSSTVLFMTDLDCGDYFHFIGRKEIYLKLEDSQVAIDLSDGQAIYSDDEEFDCVPVERIDIAICITKVYH